MAAESAPTAAAFTPFPRYRCGDGPDAPEIPFPVPPYDIQKDAMGAIRAAIAAGNGRALVLESPTGTGKT